MPSGRKFHVQRRVLIEQRMELSQTSICGFNAGETFMPSKEKALFSMIAPFLPDIFSIIPVEAENSAE